MSRDLTYSRTRYGGGFWTTRCCGDCGAYISQAGSTVRPVRNLGRQWVGRCCASKDAAAQAPGGASPGSQTSDVRTPDAVAPTSLAALGAEFSIDFTGKDPAVC